MKKIGDITNTADKNGEFTDGNVAAGTPPTQLMGAWFNSVQREILNVLAKAGVPQSATKEDQLAEAITKIVASADYLPSGYSYSKKESDGRYQPKGDYATTLDINNITSQTIFARAEAIPLNADLNDYTNAGLFYQASSNPGTNAKNYPPNSSAGSLEIVRTGATSVKQVYTDWYDKKTYTRRYNGGNKTWADKWDEDYTKLNPPTPAELNVYSIPQADNKFQLKGSYLDKDSTQEQITKGFLTATRRLSVEASDGARAVLFAVSDGAVGISAQDSTGKWLGDIKHPADGKGGTLARIEDFNTPVGMPIPWPQATAPAGYLVCNGQSFNKTSYPFLAKAYPSGVLPDLRGEFLRGLDAGRGIDSGRVVLSAQGDAFRAHNHSVIGEDSGSGTAYFGRGNGSRRSITKDAMNLEGGTETRPRNISFLYIVRAA